MFAIIKLYQSKQQSKQQVNYKANYKLISKTTDVNNCYYNQM